MRSFVVALGLLSSVTLSAQTFRPEAIHAHMNFLASDLLEGRATGARGYDLAADYVAAQFEAIGLEPGVSGSYMQPVTFRKTTPLPESSVILQRKGQAPVTYPFGSIFSTSGNPLSETSAVSGDVVFVGYGITAPELKYDDYKGVDAKGKIVAIFNGAPQSFASTMRAHYTSSLSKLENAIAHGAAAIINIGSATEYSRVPWERAMVFSKRGTLHWMRADGTPRNVFPELPLSINLSKPGVETLFAGTKQTYDQLAAAVASGKARRGPLGVRLALDIRSRHEVVRSANVVGVLPGSDPALKSESIVVTAHLDHLGITDPIDGDSINNGALDNASGIAIMLETARALAASRPRRSIVFVATTAEERGLRGADFYANNPTVPFESIVANVNIDEVYMFAPTKDITVIGEENSTLGEASRRVASAMGIELSADPFPQEVVFVRSDQYPFVRRGIPAVFPIAGYKAVDEKLDLRKMQEEWNDTRYHRPSDDMNQPLSYAPAVQMAEFAYRLLQDVGNASERPHWNAGDFFGTKFGRK